jgi:hypothetical protein
MDETCLPVETSAAAGASAVSWSAILAGVAVAVATSLTLFALAAGLGLVRPASLVDSGAGSILLWATLALIVTQWISAALGGYLSGRLRTRWARTHTHEVFFRDTAHGFITWCVATVFMASGLVAAASGVVAIRTHPAAYGRSQISASAGDSGAMSGPGTLVNDAAESVPTYVPTPSIPVSPADGQLVLPDGPGSAAAARTRQAAIVREPHLSPVPAARDDIADGTPAAPLLTALSMLIGAFIASVSAVLGGRQRDLHP